MTVSIIICTKNRPLDIARCLASVALQKRKPDQVIVVDQSESPYPIEPFGGLLHFHEPTLRGLTSARNEGIRHNVSDIAFFIDDDVELFPDTVEKLLRAFERFPEAVGMSCRDRQPHEDGWSTGLLEFVFSRGFFNKRSTWENGIEYQRWLGGYAMALRREVVERERFDESLVGYSYGEDWEMSIRARRYGKLLIAPGADVLHHRSPVNRHSALPLLRIRWTSYHYFFEKHGGHGTWGGRLSLSWWELGEVYAWLRNGLGLPWTDCAIVAPREVPQSEGLLQVKVPPKSPS